MYENNKIIVVIPARGGSKGIPRKNIRMLGDKPLIAHSIEMVLKSKYVDRVVVTTDNREIQFVAEQFGAKTIFRSPELSADDVPLDPVIYDVVIKEEKIVMDEFDFVITVQPTSPLLKTSTLDKAIEVLYSEEYDTIISVKEDSSLNWGYDTREEKFYPLYERRLNRQYLPKSYRETGGILASYRKSISPENRLGDHVGLIEVSKNESIDIDTFEDWWVAEKLLSKKRILIKTDAYNLIGTGHIFRTLSLASKLTNHEVVFLLNENHQLGIDYVKNSNFHCITHNGSNDLLEKIKEFKPDIVVNDILDTSAEYIKALKSLNIFVVNFEDLGEGTQYADIVFDALYEHQDNIGNLYSGPKYYILRDEFQYHPYKHINEDVSEILLTFGGSDPNDLTDKVLETIVESDYDKSITVILGLGYGKKEAIQKKYENNINVRILENVNNMSQYMFNADLIFTSAGRTMYEVASLAVPCVCLCQNERELSHVFANTDNGFVNLGLGSEVPKENILHTFNTLRNDFDLRYDMARKMRHVDLRHGFINIENVIKSKYADFQIKLDNKHE